MKKTLKIPLERPLFIAVIGYAFTINVIFLPMIYISNSKSIGLYAMLTDYVIVWVIAVLVSFGFLRGLSWSRYVLILAYILHMTLRYFETDNIEVATVELTIALLFLPPPIWYLFYKSNVRAYFHLT